MRPAIIVSLPQTSSTDIAHGLHPRRVQPDTLCFGNADPIQVTAKATMSSTWVRWKATSPGFLVWDNMIGPLTFVC